MRQDVRDALDSARSSGISGKRLRPFETVRNLLERVLAELPEDMTVQELRREIE